MLSRPKMSQVVYFRVDVRAFSPGDIIFPTGKFIEKHKSIGTAMEDLLRATAPPGKPERAEQLFIFEDEDCARYHYVKTTGGRLYRVTIEGKIAHHGDMALLDEIGRTVDEAKRKRLAHQYWDGKPSCNPCIEVMVPAARVINEITFTQADRMSVWRKHGYTSPDFTKESIEDLIFVQPKSDT
jgi:hypothetical protein